MPTVVEPLVVRTPGRGLVEITGGVADVVGRSRVRTGICTVFCRHTSASLLVQENADATVRADLLAWLDRLAPEGLDLYAHDSEGPDDMPAHLKAALLRTSETVPVRDGRLGLGTWQGLYLVEHRRRPHRREILVTVVGD